MATTNFLKQVLQSSGIEMRAPIARSDVTAFEALSGINLPPDYVAFITEVANGGVRPCGLLALEDWAACYWTDGVTHEHLGKPCIITPDAVRHGGAWLDHVDVDDWQAKLDNNQWDPMFGTLAVAEIGCGLFYSIIVNGPFTGRVFSYGDHIASPPRFVVQNTFNDWLAAHVDSVLHGRPVHFLDGRIR